MNRIKTVLFDLDDTLFDHRHAARCVLQHLQITNVVPGAFSLEFLEREDFRLLMEKHTLLLSGALSLEEARIQRVKGLFASCGEEIDSERARILALERVEIYRQSRRAVPGAIELLRGLRSHVKIGVVTNNFTAEQRDKMDSCGLSSLVDLLVTSEDTGFVKPAPEIFHIALDRLRCKPGEAVMIGDSWEADIVGAGNAGIRAVWFNRHQLSKPDVEHVLEITSLEPSEVVATQIIGAE